MPRRSKIKPPKRIRAEMAGWGPWEDISTRQAIAPDVRHLFVSAWRNKVYSVRIYQCLYPSFEKECLLFSITRRDARPGIPWWVKMVIKHELAGPDREAVEIYPPSHEILDAANIYYLICLPVGVSLGMHMVELERTDSW